MSTDIESRINEAEVCRSMGLYGDSLDIYENILSLVDPQDAQVQATIQKRINLLKIEIGDQDETLPSAVDAEDVLQTVFMRLVRREGYRAEPLDPLSPRVNLPQLAARAGLGTLSPYGLLVHPAYGPRLILTGLRTDHPLSPSSRWPEGGCTDCNICLRQCPQEPLVRCEIALRACQSCGICLAECPVGKYDPDH